MKKIFALALVILVFSVTPSFSADTVKKAIKKELQEMKAAVEVKNETNLIEFTGRISRAGYFTTDEGDKYKILNLDREMIGEIESRDSRFEKTYDIKCQFVQNDGKAVILKSKSDSGETYFYGNVKKSGKKRRIVNCSSINIYEIQQADNPGAKVIKKQ